MATGLWDTVLSLSAEGPSRLQLGLILARLLKLVGKQNKSSLGLINGVDFQHVAFSLA